MTKRMFIDLAERTGATFAQAFLAVITVDASGVTQLDAIKVAGVAGGYAVAKFLLGKATVYLHSPDAVLAPPAPMPVMMAVPAPVAPVVVEAPAQP